MNKTLLFVVSVSLMPPLFSEHNNSNNPTTSIAVDSCTDQSSIRAVCQYCGKDHDQEDNTTQIVLTNFASMIGHFIQMTQNPDNSHNVAQNLGGIIHGVANIVSNVVKRGCIAHDDTVRAELEKTLIFLNSQECFEILQCMACKSLGRHQQ